MSLFSKFFVLFGCLVSVTAGAADAEHIGNATELNDSFKVENSPLSAALDTLNSAYGLEVRLDDSRWKDLAVTGSIAGGNVSVMIRALLRDYDFVLQREVGERWLLSIYGPISPRRSGAATESGWKGSVRSDERLKTAEIEPDPVEPERPDGRSGLIRDPVLPSLDEVAVPEPAPEGVIEPAWIELEDPDGTGELIRNRVSTFRNDVASTGYLPEGGITPAGIELEGPGGIAEFTKAPGTTPENDIADVVPSAGVGGPLPGLTELDGPIDMDELVNVPKISSQNALEQAPASVGDGGRQPEQMELEGLASVGKFIRSQDQKVGDQGAGTVSLADTGIQRGQRTLSVTVTTNAVIKIRWE